MFSWLKSPKAFLRLNLALIPYTLVVIGWGAFVRMSGSGDGCGKSWPLCHGAIIPEGDAALLLQTWIEFFHRMKSGLLSLGILFLLISAFRIFKPGHLARKAATATALFTLSEALLGAWLVLGGLVDTNESSLRVFVVGLHSINTFVLLGSLVLSYVWAQDEDPRIEFEWRDSILPSVLALASFLFIAILGSLSSLSNTLYPSASLLSGWHADFNPDSPSLVRLRWLHPLAALMIAGFLIYFSIQVRHRLARYFPLIIVIGIVIGIAALISLSPLWLKITHLLWADIIWIYLVVLAAARVTKPRIKVST